MSVTENIRGNKVTHRAISIAPADHGSFWITFFIESPDILLSCSVKARRYSATKKSSFIAHDVNKTIYFESARISSHPSSVKTYLVGVV